MPVIYSCVRVHPFYLCRVKVSSLSLGEQQKFTRSISVLFISETCFFPQAANDCELEPIAYEFFTQAFVLYEEEVAVIAHL